MLSRAKPVDKAYDDHDIIVVRIHYPDKMRFDLTPFYFQENAQNETLRVAERGVAALYKEKDITRAEEAVGKDAVDLAFIYLLSKRYDIVQIFKKMTLKERLFIFPMYELADALNHETGIKNGHARDRTLSGYAKLIADEINSMCGQHAVVLNDIETGRDHVSLAREHDSARLLGVESPDGKFPLISKNRGILEKITEALNSNGIDYRWSNELTHESFGVIWVDIRPLIDRANEKRLNSIVGRSIEGNMDFLFRWYIRNPNENAEHLARSIVANLDEGNAKGCAYGIAERVKTTRLTEEEMQHIVGIVAQVIERSNKSVAGIFREGIREKAEQRPHSNPFLSAELSAERNKRLQEFFSRIFANENMRE